MKLVIGMFCVLSGIVAFTSLRHGGISKNVVPEPPNATEMRLAPVLVELFTSEGCSSCPPADDVLSRLIKAEAIPGVEVIALGEHVDYWNNLGWADPYSKADFSKRQRGYSEALNLDSVYTPQMIVDGREEFVGNDWNRARAAIASAAKNQKGRIELELSEDSSPNQNPAVLKLSIRVIDLPGSTTGDVAAVLLAITENNLQSEVSRGENGGRSLRHSAVVRELIVVGGIPGGDKTFQADRVLPISPNWHRENLRVIAFVQERHSHQVLAVGHISLETN